jgi:uncharacterized protein (DUF1778 family)
MRQHYITNPSPLLEAAFEPAKRVWQEYETITLSNNVECDRFFALLETSDESNNFLKAVMSEDQEVRRHTITEVRVK